MSLDVHLTGGATSVPCRCSACGHEHTREYVEDLFHANITHNLNLMAQAAGIYEHLWRPEEIGITKAAQLIEPLRVGLALMRADPARFEKYNAKNGWGLYDHFVPWIATYLAACETYPDANVSVSR